MKLSQWLLLAASAIVLCACYGSIPPEPPCSDVVAPDGKPLETRLRRNMSRRPVEVWHVYRDSAGNWIRHGRAIRYFLNGQTKSVEWWRDGKLEGPASYWFENGEKQGEITYAGGLPEGIARSWYDNGVKESEKTWSQGKLEGKELHWDRRGRLILELNWKANRLTERKEYQP